MDICTSLSPHVQPQTPSPQGHGFRRVPALRGPDDIVGVGQLDGGRDAEQGKPAKHVDMELVERSSILESLKAMMNDMSVIT